MWFECSPIINGARQKAWQINSHHQVSAHQMRNFPTLSQLIRFINIWIRCWASWPSSPINDRKSGQWMRFSTSHAAYSITNDLKSSTGSSVYLPDWSSRWALISSSWSYRAKLSLSNWRKESMYTMTVASMFYLSEFDY